MVSTKLEAGSSPSRRLVDLLRGHDHASAALLSPDEPALSFADLARRVDYMGRVLRASDIGVSDRVATLLPNGLGMASAFLGIACYSTCAPLNPQFGRAELEFYFADLEVRAILVPAGLDTPARQIAMKAGMNVFDLDTGVQSTDGFRVAGFETAPILIAEPGEANDVALILHTSGTTSRPKMVPLTHHNLRASAMAIGQTLALTPSDACLNVMPLFHIHGLVGVLLSSLAAGASVICSPGFDGNQFAEWLTGTRPTWYSAVPTIHQSVLEVVKNRPKRMDHNLRFIRSSSSALPPVVMAKLEEAFGVPVIESYGMTEASHQMASNPLPPGERRPGSVGMAGGPSVAIMNDAGVILGAGEIGEIVIRGPGVTAGYVNNPVANQAAFANGWFRTGDQGYLDGDNYLYITGRLKEIINRAGEKVSPREVDDALLEHPAVSQAVTFAVPHATLGEDVVAAVVVRDGSGIMADDLRAFAFSRLVPAKVPSQILIVTAIPKGPTGKVQRIGLHEKLGWLLQSDYVAPRTSVEETLVALWTEVLEIEQVGVHDNFFTLGGDSLRAMRVMSRILDRLGVETSAADLFRQPTIAQFALIVERAQEETMAKLLEYVDQLSAEEVDKLLRESDS